MAQARINTVAVAHLCGAPARTLYANVCGRRFGLARAQCYFRARITRFGTVVLQPKPNTQQKIRASPHFPIAE